MKEEKYKEAITEFEKALPSIPGDTAELQTVQRQVQQVLAQAYYKTGDVKKAIEFLEKVTAVTSDPFASANASPMTGVQLLLVTLYLENGQLDKGKALLEKLPAGSVTDPIIYINMGILILNQKKPADALSYFSKAIELNADAAEGYYYRGLTYVQIKKNKEARADLEKVLALAPADSPDARDAKLLLAGLK